MTDWIKHPDDCQCEICQKYVPETVAQILKANEGPFEEVPSDPVEFLRWLESETDVRRD